MQQPELGKKLTALRKEKNLTQEELVEKSHVSVRTIQRIESGEVLPRMSTVKILLKALGESPELFSTQPTNTMEAKANPLRDSTRTTILIAVFAGAIYLSVEIILGAMDIAWLNKDNEWSPWTNLIYTCLTVVMATSYILFVRGFIVLGDIFENTLLKISGYLMMAVVVGMGILDVVTLSSTDVETLGLPYASAAVLGGAMSILFGVGLIRLQDGMGELSRAAGILEIIIGCSLITVILFFIGLVILVPAIIVEILVLYRGYEYLTRSEATTT